MPGTSEAISCPPELHRSVAVCFDLVSDVVCNNNHETIAIETNRGDIWTFFSTNPSRETQSPFSSGVLLCHASNCIGTEMDAMLWDENVDSEIAEFDEEPNDSPVLISFPNKCLCFKISSSLSVMGWGHEEMHVCCNGKLICKKSFTS